MELIESLCEWDAGVERLPEMRERLRRRPEYAATARTLAANLLRDSEEDPALAGMLRDAGRTVAALSAVSLNASGAVTLARLKSFIAGFGLVSPGRARALLSYMLYLGYLEPDPAESKPRQAAYQATQSFLTSYLRHEASLLSAVRVIEPGVNLLLARLAEPQVLHALVVEQGKAFAEGSRQTPAYADWYRVFMHPLGGIQILHKLVAEGRAFPPDDWLDFAAADAAQRFNVSRVHVARILKAADASGFLDVQPNAVRFTPAGCEALDWLYASRLCVHLACAARALKAMLQFRTGAAA